MSEPTPGSAQGEDATAGDDSAASDDTAASAPTRRADRHATAHRHPWLRRVVFGIAAVLVVTLVLAVGVYLKLTGNINRIDISGALGRRPAPAATTDKVTNLAPLNVMVMGSDTRQGQGSSFGSVSGARSDTNLLVHLSADRKTAIVVSIPRDSMTKAPADCKNKSDTVQNGVMRQWNDNFTLGGPACTIRTFEGLTNIYVNHYIVIDFGGFKSMVDALGGVTVCTPTAINDPLSGLKLPPGRSKLDGVQALGYVRARYTIGDGSDLSRIDRQQAFLSSVIQGATQSSLLLRPDRLFRFLDAATQATTTDMGIGDMKDLAESVRNIGLSQIKFVRLPTEPYVADPNRVQWTSAADALWAAIRSDQPLPGTKAPTATPTGSPTSDQPLTVSPSAIQVRVTNSSGVPGIAKQAAAALQVQGFTVVSYVTGTGPVTKGAVVRYGPGRSEAARTVAAAFPGAQLKEDPLVGSTIELSLGAGSPNAVAVSNRLGTQPLPSPSVTASQGPAATPVPTIKARSANQDICS